MKYKLKTVVIDHSPTQRRLISYLVQKSISLDLICERGSGQGIDQLLSNWQPDLIIIDIEFSGLNEFDFSKILEAGVQIVLVTANPSYALKAFELGVTDYMMKPVQKNRFQAALNRVSVNYEILNRPAPDEDYLKVKSDQNIKEIPLSEIRWIEALGDYVKIVTISERILVLSTLTSIEDQLPGNKFLRIHRSYIVNLDKVENFSSTSVEVEGKNLPMSRKRGATLEAKLIPDLQS